MFEEEESDEKYYIQEGDEDYVDELQFGAERNAYERTHYGAVESGTELIKKLGNKNMNEIYRALFRLGYTDEDRFSFILELANRKLYNKLSPTDLDNIKNLVIKNKSDKLNYLNPYCLILGYYVSTGGKNIEMERLEKLDNIIIKLDGVSKYDVIRYSRFFIQNK